MSIEQEDRIHLSAGPGAPPGTLIVEADAVSPALWVIGYDADSYREDVLLDARELSAWLDRWAVTWIDIDGIGDLELIQEMGTRFKIHPLALEDIVQPHQRAKLDLYDDALFAVIRMVVPGDELTTEQVSVVLGDGFVITFQEGLPGDSLEPVRRRIREAGGQIRSRGPDYLLYALFDAVVDHYFPVMEVYAERLEALEDMILKGASVQVVPRVHAIKRELVTLRRILRPFRDLVAQLRPELTPALSPEIRPYLRDVRDHVAQLLDLLDTYHELARSLVDLQLSLADHRSNEVMKVLTIVGSIFLPLTFITGLYGMNFDRDISPWNMPELGWAFGYGWALGWMLLVTLAMLVWFRRRRWL